MRVVTGSARGTKLITPSGDAVRPTSDRAKEGIFSAIQFEVEGARILDLFCGSGQLGIEALSRGADWAVFVDASAASVDATRQNLMGADLLERARIFTQDAASYVGRCKEQFDIVFMDPPYAELKLGSGLVVKLAALVSPGGVIFYETARGADVPERAGNFVLARYYHYGKSSIAAYRSREETL